MKFRIRQVVTIVDMNNELISEAVFEHGEFQSVFLPIGSSVISHPLGLKGFDVVYDKRTDETRRYKIVDLEMSLLEEQSHIHAYLEPVTLILGQHDIGEFSG